MGHGFLGYCSKVANWQPQHWTNVASLVLVSNKRIMVLYYLLNH